ncbi:ADP-ribosyltransferase-containing protein [Poseidonibacter ostreae]|uniref:ART-PolyVal-like domain-containing protein n=1 Tax=Poseidonibacter ostreae TaxID=2654171 RepID=A0A6L4WXT1_9BACT|nr:hypothetical protein [Poseidonibacter ostreae]KAB7891260.1 hypothetical protein GBG19_00055 [Poseidonibacter ostreae]
MNSKNEKLAILTDYILQYIPENNKSKDNIVQWLKESPYSPYITLYGGINSNTYDSEKSFTSSLDGLKRYKLKDETLFKFENFKNFDNKILSANTSLKNIISSDELFKAYPEFKDIEVSINISNNNKGFESGANHYNQNKIEVFADNTLNAMKVLIHELQHSIQLKEGFSLGASYYNEDGIMDSVKSLAQKEKRGIYNVQYNGKSSTPLYNDLNDKSEGNTRYKKGKSFRYRDSKGKLIENGSGARHVRKHLNPNRAGFVYAKELMDMPEMLRNQKPIHTTKKKEVYEFTNDKNIKFRLIAQKNSAVISFYSYRKRGANRKENTVSQSYSFQDENKKELKNEPLISKQNRAKNFDNWFGKSVVTDVLDNPLVVYNGTYKNFESFNTSLGENSQFGRGAYFTSSIEDVNNYASKDVSKNFDIPAKAEALQSSLGISYKEAREAVLEGNEQIYPVYLKMENPLHIGGSTITSTLKNVEVSMKIAGVENANYNARLFMFIDELAQTTSDNDSNEFFEAIQYNSYDLNPNSVHKLLERKNYDLVGLQMELLTSQGARELMITENKDGIIYHNVDNKFRWLNENANHYFIRRPEQIKSIHNIGNFDISKDNILEKNELGLRHIEKALSIVPSGLDTNTVKDYLDFNNVTHENMRGTIYQNVLNSETHTNIFEDKDIDKFEIDTSSDYYNAKGEIEAREVEEEYMQMNI